MQRRPKIIDLNIYHPKRVVTNQELQSSINHKKEWLQDGVLKKIFGIEERRFAAKDEQVSDLAASAAMPIIKEHKATIDLLIFASACADLIEPATANIVQQKLGLHCPCLDIKNACNSFTSAIQVASAFLEAGRYQKILIVSGEKLSDAINFDIQDKKHLNQALSSFTLGDAGAAMLLGYNTETDSGFYQQAFHTNGQHWDLCTIRGGGSLHKYEAEHFFFTGETAALKNAFLEEGIPFLGQQISIDQWSLDQYDHLLTHQVSKETFDVVRQSLGFTKSVSTQVFEKFGNTASCSIPMAWYYLRKDGELRKGDKLLIIGLAAGLSMSYQSYLWD